MPLFSGPPVRFLSAAGVAQMVEQRFRKPQVAGSIPVAGSRLLVFPLWSRPVLLSNLSSQSTDALFAAELRKAFLEVDLLV